MLKQSECSKLAKAKFKQAAQGRAEPQGESVSRREPTVAEATPLRPLLSFEILFYSLLLMLLLLLMLMLLMLLMLLAAESADAVLLMSDF